MIRTYHPGALQQSKELVDRPMTRRDFGKASLLAGAGLIIGGCGTTGTKSAGVVAPPGSAKVTGPLSWAAWPSAVPTKQIGEFEHEYGVHVNYREVINSTEEFRASVEPELVAGQPTGWDVFFVDDVSGPAFKENGWLEELNQSALPHASKNLLPALHGIHKWDPDQRFHYPFDWGAFGVSYDKTRLPEGIGTWEDMFKPELSGKVSLYSGFSETVGNMSTILRARGEISHSPTDLTYGDAVKVIEFLKPYVQNGHFRIPRGEQSVQLLASGDLIATMAASATAAYSNRKKIAFSYPDPGLLQYVTGIVIPVHARHGRAAEAMIDFWYVPENAAAFAEFILEYPVCDGVLALLSHQDPSLVVDPLVNPSQAIREKLHAYPTWTQKEYQELATLWGQVTGV